MDIFLDIFSKGYGLVSVCIISWWDPFVDIRMYRRSLFLRAGKLPPVPADVTLFLGMDGAKLYCGLQLFSGAVRAKEIGYTK
ncbi:hypothetical protein U1Q18_044607 [Sarracenia purpurea var. burkii]